MQVARAPLCLLLTASVGLVGLSTAQTQATPTPKVGGVPALSQQAFLKASNAGQDDFLGTAIAVDGDTLVVAAQSEMSNATGVDGDRTNNSVLGAGAAYVFVRDGTMWSQEAYLKAASVDVQDFFGYAVAVSGDTVVVGMLNEASAATGVDGDPTDDSLPGAGAAYVFVRDGSTWSQQAYLKASNTGPDAFGESVAISGDTIVVGASVEDSAATVVNGNQNDESASNAGAAYVFVRSGTTWSQQAYLKAWNAEAGDGFGAAVAISGDTVLVTAVNEDGSSSGAGGDPADNATLNAGAGYVFVRSGTTWTPQAYLKATNPDVWDQFGRRAALSGDVAVIGTQSEDSASTGVDGDGSDNSASDSGAAYVFERTGTVWSAAAYLKASNAEASDFFGASVAVSNGRVVVGAFQESSDATGVNGDEQNNLASGSGAAYVFESNGASWTQTAYLKPSDTFPGNRFGGSVSASGAVITAGAPRESTVALRSGAAYVFDGDVGPTPYCTAKTSSAGCVAQIATSRPAAHPTSAATDYSVVATAVQEGKNGLLFAGLSGAAAIPFNNGVLCVAPPTKRGPILSSGGVDPTGCNGSFSTLVNDGLVIPLGLDAGSGNSGWYQYWYRDPQNGPGQLGTALSDAVQLDFL